MAEFAQRSIEEMLAEVDKMRKIGLFSHDETRYAFKLQICHFSFPFRIS